MVIVQGFVKGRSLKITFASKSIRKPLKKINTYISEWYSLIFFFTKKFNLGHS
jgi:hypothetical protein